MRALTAIALVLIVILTLAYIEGRKPEYAIQVVYGTIVSDGVVSSSRGVTGPIDSVVMVACDDKILTRIAITNDTLAQGYKMVYGERVKLERRKSIAIIPFLESNSYDGRLVKMN